MIIQHEARKMTSAPNTADRTVDLGAAEVAAPPSSGQESGGQSSAGSCSGTKHRTASGHNIANQAEKCVDEGREGGAKGSYMPYCRRQLLAAA